MKFTPKTEDELSSFENLPEGDYPFTVIESDEQPSKSAKNAGRLMAKVKLNVHGPNYDRHVYDYFADWFSEWKLKHFCEVTGMAAAYSRGQVDSSNGSWKGLEGMVRISVEAGTGDYPSKNVVHDYLPSESQKVESVVAQKPIKASNAEPQPDDDVPF